MIKTKVVQWNTFELAKWIAADAVSVNDMAMEEGARLQRRFTVKKLIELQNRIMDEES